MCIPIICSVRAIFSMLSAAKKARRACPNGWMKQDKTTGTVKPVPVFYAVLYVGRILSLSRTSFYDSICCFVFFFSVNKKKHIHATRTLSPSGICRRAAKSRHSDRLHCLGKVKFVHCFSVTKNRFFISSCHFGSSHTTPRHRFQGCSFRQL